MFDIPKWEEDVPKSNLTFSMKTKAKNRERKEKNNNSKSKVTPIKKKSFKSKIASPKANFKNIHNVKLNRNDYFAQKRQLNKQIAQNKKEATRKQNRNSTSKNIKLMKKNNLNDRSNKIKAKSQVLNSEVEIDTNNKEKFITELDNLDLPTFDADKPDEALISAKKIKFNENIKNEDVEHLLFGNNDKEDKVKDTKITTKKEKLKRVLGLVNRSSVNVSSTKLRDRMLERLKAAQFRYLNERLYTTTGSEAIELFQSDPNAFEVYHQGYEQQLKKWPVNPLDVIVKRIMKMPKSAVIADMGCGKAELSRRVPQRVVSVDAGASAGDTDRVLRCDMARTPLPGAALHAAVYCLSLMGTQLTLYLLEANRVLKEGGLLLIAEVESRFDNVDTFVQDVQRLGFKLKKLDKTNKMFFFMEFVKIRDPPVKKSKLPTITLKPCLYKRR